MHGTIQKGLRYGAALVLAMALCATAALAAGTEGKRLVPVGHTVGVKLFARGVVVVKLPEGGTPARSCGLQTGDVIEASILTENWRLLPAPPTYYTRYAITYNGEVIRQDSKTARVYTVTRVVLDELLKCGTSQ